MRIEINLTEEVAKAIQEKAEAQNHSRKSYIELLCINDVKKKSPIPQYVSCRFWQYHVSGSVRLIKINLVVTIFIRIFVVWKI